MPRHVFKFRRYFVEYTDILSNRQRLETHVLESVGRYSPPPRVNQMLFNCLGNFFFVCLLSASADNGTLMRRDAIPEVNEIAKEPRCFFGVGVLQPTSSN